MGEIRFVGTGETRGYPYLVCKKIFSCIPDKDIHVFYLDRQFLSVVVAPITMEGGWGKQIRKNAIFRHFPMDTEIVCGHFDISAY